MPIKLLTYIILILVSTNSQSDLASEAYNSGNFLLAAKHYQILSDAGDPIAKNNLGAMYLRGKGVEVDFYKAKRLFEAAAKKNCRAQCSI
jgi:uncharacterized protein